MFPFVFEWQWNADHYIFLGFTYLVLIIIGVGLHVAAIKTILGLMGFVRERHF
jgi:hypothetical protein